MYQKHGLPRPSLYRPISGFTLIEMIIVVVILTVVGAVAIPKFIDLSKDAEEAVMKAKMTSISSAVEQVQFQIALHPDNFSGKRQQRFTMSNGQQIQMRGGYPDARWNNTFQYLVDFANTGRINKNNCDSDTLDWCVRERNKGWFNKKVFIDNKQRRGRGFVIAPNGYNVGQSKCYVYYFNPNRKRLRGEPVEPIIGMDTSGC